MEKLMTNELYRIILDTDIREMYERSCEQYKSLSLLPLPLPSLPKSEQSSSSSLSSLSLSSYTETNTIDNIPYPINEDVEIKELKETKEGIEDILNELNSRFAKPSAPAKLYTKVQLPMHIYTVYKKQTFGGLAL